MSKRSASPGRVNTALELSENEHIAQCLLLADHSVFRDSGSRRRRCHGEAKVLHNKTMVIYSTQKYQV